MNTRGKVPLVTPLPESPTVLVLDHGSDLIEGLLAMTFPDEVRFVHVRSISEAASKRVDGIDSVLIRVASSRLDIDGMVKSTRRMASLHRATTAVVCEAGDASVIVPTAIRAGADDYLTLPLQAHETLVRIRNLVRMRREAFDRSREHTRLTRVQEDLRRQATSDALTGLQNRRAFVEILGQAVTLATSQSADLSVIAIDVDHFKRVNDTYGHAAGDQVLCAVADVLRRTVRGSDVVARVGGEEFMVLAPRSDRTGVNIAAERLRAALAAAPVFLRSGSGAHLRLAVTASFGVSTLRPHGGPICTDPGELLEQADLALYAAKRNGRNRVEAYAHEMRANAEAELAKLATG